MILNKGNVIVQQVDEQTKITQLQVRQKGIVLDTGKGCHVKKGDMVAFQYGGGMEFQGNILLKERQIFCILS